MATKIQDMPPPGGYQKIDFKRIPARKYVSLGRVKEFFLIFFEISTVQRLSNDCRICGHNHRRLLPLLPKLREHGSWNCRDEIRSTCFVSLGEFTCENLMRIQLIYGFSSTLNAIANFWSKPDETVKRRPVSWRMFPDGKLELGTASPSSRPCQTTLCWIRIGKISALTQIIKLTPTEPTSICGTKCLYFFVL